MFVLFDCFAFDFQFKGDYIRLWVPELQQIKGGAVHTPWALSSSALSHANVTLGKTYPLPIVMAPEWSRHINQRPVSVCKFIYVHTVIELLFGY